MPDSKTIPIQAGNTLIYKKMVEVHTFASQHTFAFYCGDPSGYKTPLEGRLITSTKGHGIKVDLYCEEDISITIGDGTIIRYFLPCDQCPGKYQLLIEFDDASFVAYSVAMYRGRWAYSGPFDSHRSISWRCNMFLSGLSTTLNIIQKVIIGKRKENECLVKY